MVLTTGCLTQRTLRTILAVAFILVGCGQPSSLQPMSQLTIAPGIFGPLAWSPDGTLLASSNSRGEVLLWHWDGSNLIQQESLTIDRGEVCALEWHPEEAKLVGLVSAEDATSDTIYVWDVSTRKATIVERRAHPSYYCEVGWNSNGSRLAATSSDLHVWDSGKLKQLGVFPGVINVEAWSPDGQRVIERLQNGDVQMVDLDTGQPVVSLELSPPGIFDPGVFRWSPDSTRLAATDDDNNLRIWNAENGKQIHIVASKNIHSAESDLAWSPNGQQIALGALQIWDTRTAQEVSSFKYADGWVDKFRWNEDGSQLAAVVSSVDEPTEVWVWDVTAGKSRKILQFRGSVDISWSPQGHLLALRLADSVQIWNIDKLP